jgi:hypothetical protein
VPAWIPGDNARLFWFIQTYHDRPQLRKTLARLRRVYPESQALVVSDGDEDPAIAEDCGHFSAGFTLRSRLFGVEHGGESVHQMLEAFAAADADILLKIDPDTNVRHRFRRMPSSTESAIYGSVQASGPKGEELISIQGGCIIVPRHAATQLLRSGLLRSDRLRPPELVWAVNKLSKDRAAAGLTSQDWTLGWACRELGIICAAHPEVFANYRPRLIDAMRKRRAAVSHPRFELRHLAKPGFYQWFGPFSREIAKRLPQ